MLFLAARLMWNRVIILLIKMRRMLFCRGFILHVSLVRGPDGGSLPFRLGVAAYVVLLRCLLLLRAELNSKMIMSDVRIETL